MTHFADRAPDVAAFAKNAGPQALRIDYLSLDGRRAIYTPDFITRKTDGHYLLIETKGRADRDVPARARAAVEWCKAASGKKAKWQYVYVPQAVFEQISGNTIEEVVRACAPSLADLILESKTGQQVLTFDEATAERTAEQLKAFIDSVALERLPSRYRKALEHAITLFYFHEKKEDVSYGPVFQPLLGPIDHAAEALLRDRLQAEVPVVQTEQKDFFEPIMSSVDEKTLPFLKEQARLLQRLLVHNAPLMPTGVLKFCLEYAISKKESPPGIFRLVRTRFSDLAGTDLRNLITKVYDFRNTYIAHEKKDLNQREETREALRTWAQTLYALYTAHH